MANDINKHERARQNRKCKLTSESTSVLRRAALKGIGATVFIGASGLSGSAQPQLLQNPSFDSSLSNWEVTYNDPDNQARGSAEWTSEYGGSAEMSVSGAPSNIIIYQDTATQIPEGTEFTVDVVSAGSLSCCGGVSLQIAGERVAHLRHPSNGDHQLSFTTKEERSAGTRFALRTAIWPGSGTAYVREIGWQLDNSDSGGTTETGPDGEPDIDARIESFTVNGGSFSPGSEVEATTTVENTGGDEHTFFVGYSATPDGSNSVYDDDGSTGQSVTISPGETVSVDLSLTLPADAPTGDYTLITSVWQESDPDNLSTRLDTSDQPITVSEPNSYFSVAVRGPFSSNAVADATVGLYHISVGTKTVSSVVDDVNQDNVEKISESSTSSGGVATFDESATEPIPDSELSELRSRYSNQILAIASKNSESDSGPWFDSILRDSDQFWDQDSQSTMTLAHQVLYPPTTVSDMQGEVSVWRTFSKGNRTSQIVQVGISRADSPKFGQDVDDLGDGGCSLRVPEDVEVLYENTQTYHSKRSNDVRHYDMASFAAAGFASDIPVQNLFADKFVPISIDEVEANARSEDVVYDVLGVTPLTSVFVGAYEHIVQPLMGDGRIIASLGEDVETSRNEYDTITSVSWNSAPFAVVFSVPLQFEDTESSPYEFVASGVWGDGNDKFTFELPLEISSSEISIPN
ncbi:COG1470 family protein [Halobaculum limi]|uniref:COG1470 family protein n=1 Tax=Halobaculum limi TaxID=3031916 RepID=UPI002405F5DC|nr:NEW3 domain-containing protein [Halobaculum sp. YSMS11]